MNKLNRLFVFLSVFMATNSFAAKFSDTSLDGKFGKESVTGELVDTAGGTGGAIEKGSTSIINVVVGFCAFLGFVICAKSLYDMYSVSRGRDGSGYTKPIIGLIVGSALAVLPVIVFLGSNTLEGASTN